MSLQVESRSWAYHMGQCAVWMNDDTLCDLPRGHEGDHRGHSPYGDGRWIECDTEGRITRRGCYRDRDPN